MAAKAPERIKREIVNLPISKGGLGMLDITALDESLKLRALGRIYNSQHPFLKILKRKLILTQFFRPTMEVKLERVVERGTELLKQDRLGLWEKAELGKDVRFLKFVRDSEIKEVISKEGSNSIPFYLIWRRGARKVEDLTANDLARLTRYINPSRLAAIEAAARYRLEAPTENEQLMFYMNGKWRHLAVCSSKEIRLQRANQEPLTNFKIGLNLTRAESLSWAHRITKVTSTRHKNTILKIAHGEVYTKEKLFRFGLAPDPRCPRCDEIETLRHKFVECDYVKRIWAKVFELTGSITTANIQSVETTQAILGAYLDSNSAIITINSEILQRIQYLKNDNYLIHPRIIAKAAINSVARMEKEGQNKDMIKSIQV